MMSRAVAGVELTGRSMGGCNDFISGAGSLAACPKCAKGSTFRRRRYAEDVDNLESNPADPSGPATFEALAARQGVSRVDSIETLMGKSAPGDESADKFLDMLRRCREGHGPQ